LTNIEPELISPYPPAELRTKLNLFYNNLKSKSNNLKSHNLKSNNLKSNNLKSLAVVLVVLGVAIPAIIRLQS
jgi:hypothetical protein